jgi:hypothetical protein
MNMSWEWFVFIIIALSLGAGVVLFTICVKADLGRGWGLFWGFLAMLAAFVIAFLTLAPYRFVDNYELGYRYDSLTGKITILDRTGYIGRTPFIQNIHTIDTRPRQVCINVGGGQNTSTSVVNQRVLNCKLVSFNPKGLSLFLSWHGRGDYSGELLNDLLKIYAYDPSGRTYPFLNVSDETRPVVSPQAVGQPISPTGTPVTQ